MKINVVGMILQLVAFAWILFNVPDASPFGETLDVGILRGVSVTQLCFTSVLIGIGDGLLTAQTFVVISEKFSQNALEAFALFEVR